MMKTPIVDFVKDYVNQNTLRAHMPGHKGAEFLGCEKFDITEIDGADVLYNAKGIIKESEENAAELFDSEKTLYSAEGSSLSIRAMLYLTKLYAESKGKKAFVAAGRNAHKTFVTAAALLDFEVDWFLPENSGSLIACDISGEFLDNYLKDLAEKPQAVYVTSPDYLGNVLDIRSLSEVCRKYGVLLLVDNAHGAYLKFLPEPWHPMDMGADMCCDSAHKTLPVLTGGAYLHIGKNAPRLLLEAAENAMSLFASTSPSYLILQSLDMANKYISDGYRQRLARFIMRIDGLKKTLKKCGYQLFGNEPLKITIAPKPYGYTGYELADILSQNGIICEFSDPDFMVIMLTTEIGDSELDKLENVLCRIEKKEAILSFPPKPDIKAKRLSLRDAVFSPFEEIETERASGRILATATVNCPPAIPIVICGEEIDEKAVEAFRYYGINKCCVVRLTRVEPVSLSRGGISELA